jgi:hypothetical protein
MATRSDVACDSPRRGAIHEENPLARTTHRSSKGTKLYAKRDKKGKFKDVQSYKRAHGGDLRKKGTKSDK